MLGAGLLHSFAHLRKYRGLGFEQSGGSNRRCSRENRTPPLSPYTRAGLLLLPPGSARPSGAISAPAARRNLVMMPHSPGAIRSRTTPALASPSRLASSPRSPSAPP